MLQNDNDIVLDFFAGSGTTAHAVMEQNAKDGGNRRYILVQIPEYTDEKSEAYKAGYKTISDICIERVKRASAKIKQDNPDSNIDGGYRVYKLTDSNFPENLFRFSTENTPEQNVQSFHDYMANFKAQGNLFPDENLPNIITEIALKNGYGLFYTLERLEDKFPDNNVHLLSGNNKSCLLCLDANVQESTVEIIINNHVENQLIIRSDGLDTTKTWQLQNALGDNLKVI
jgi:adenine-specific DNA-methyltransferase